MTTPGHRSRLAVLLGIVLVTAVAPAAADTLVLPAGVLPRGGPVAVAYRLDAKLTGTGRLSLEWTDGAGRVVEQLTMPVALNVQDRFDFSIDLRRAVVARNTLRARLALPGHDGEAKVDFLAAPTSSGWAEYQVIMWQGGSSARYAALKRLGITAATITGLRGDVPEAELRPRIAGPLDADLRWYPENVATDFYAPYHRYTPDHADVTWLWLETLRRHGENPADPGVFHRDPSLSDPAWLASTADRMRRTVTRLRPFRPLFYNLADEPGIADLAAFWDFDFSPPALTAFRQHLRGQYVSLDLLNRQWGTGFDSWEAVLPETTPAAIARADGNFSAWADFRAWMDIAFAAAVKHGTAATHDADPQALAGLEGGQIPGTGGWDYARLAPAVDVLEIYETGGNVAMARAFNPRLKILATSFDGGRRGLWGIWRSLLGGGAGLVIWDDASDFVAADGTPSPRGREMAPVLREIGAGLGAQLVASRVSHDRVAVLYSDASHRVRWLLDRRAGGKPWSARGSEAEGIEQDALRRSLHGVMSSLAPLGVQPRFVSPEQLEAGVLRAAGGTDPPPLVLVLPHAIALSDREAAEIAAFAADGGTVLADTAPDAEPGRYDAHGRRRDVPKLAAMFAPIPPDQDAMAAVLARAGAPPRLRLLGTDGMPVRNVQMRLLQNGGVTLVGLQRDLAGETPGLSQRLTVELPAPAWLHDLRSGTVRQAVARHEIDLSADTPTVFALAAARLPQPVLSGPRDLHAGGTAVWRLTMDGETPAAAHALHVEVTGPGDIAAPLYSGNMVLRGRTGTWAVPFAMDDAAGAWKICVTDRLGGGVAAGELMLK